MESKKFVNLTSNYKNFLLDCENIFKLIELNDILSIEKLNDIYININLCIQSNELQISDINHLIQNYSKPNDQVNNLKKFVYLRNYLIIKILLRSSKWKDFISKLKIKCNNANTKNVENAFIKLLEKYLGMWNTIDKIINLDKRNNIKMVEIIDPDDYSFIFNILKI
jgi:hypothetical protein